MTTEPKTNRSPHPTPEDLRAAFTENWLQARHLDTQRFLLLNFQFVVAAGVASFLATNGESRTNEQVLFGLFLTLFVFSFLVHLVLLKVSYDLATQFRAVQWVSERMQLIEKWENYDNDVAKDAMFRGFVGLPLPLVVPFRTTTLLFVTLPALTTSAVLGFSVYYGLHGFTELSHRLSASISVFIGLLCLLLVGPRGVIEVKLAEQREAILSRRRPPDLKVRHRDEINDHSGSLSGWLPKVVLLACIIDIIVFFLVLFGPL